MAVRKTDLIKKLEKSRKEFWEEIVDKKLEAEFLANPNLPIEFREEDFRNLLQFNNDFFQTLHAFYPDWDIELQWGEPGGTLLIFS